MADHDAGRWFAVPGKAEKDAARREKIRERKEARRQEKMEEEQTTIGGVPVAFNQNNNNKATSKNKEQHHFYAAAAAEEDDENSAAYMTMTIRERKQAEARRRKEEEAILAEQRQAEAEAQRRRNAARERAAKSRDPATWPTLDDALTDCAAELTEKLDDLHSDPVCAGDVLRLEYALSTTKNVLGEKVRECPDMETLVWGAAAAAGEEGEGKKDDKLEEAIDALYAHGRAVSGMKDIMDALDTSNFWRTCFSSSSSSSAQQHQNVAFKFAVEGILRGSSFVTLAEMDIALDYFVTKKGGVAAFLSDSNNSCVKQLQFVYSCLLRSLLDDSNTESDDTVTAYVAQMTCGCVRLFNFLSRMMKASPKEVEESDVPWRLMVWLARVVSNVLFDLDEKLVTTTNSSTTAERRSGFKGPATHKDAHKPVLLQAEAPLTLLHKIKNLQDNANPIALLLLLCGPRHHANFTKMTLPTMIKKANADNDFVIYCLASCLVATHDKDGIVYPQAAIGSSSADRFWSVVGTEQFLKVLVRSGTGPVDATLQKDLTETMKKKLSGGGDDADTKAMVQKSLKVLGAMSSSSSSSSSFLSLAGKPRPAAAAAAAATATTTAASSSSPSQSLPLRANFDNKTQKDQQKNNDPDQSSVSFVFLLLAIMFFGFWLVALVIRTPESVFATLKQWGLPTEQLMELRKTIEGLVKKYAPTAV